MTAFFGSVGATVEPAHGHQRDWCERTPDVRSESDETSTCYDGGPTLFASLKDIEYHDTRWRRVRSSFDDGHLAASSFGVDDKAEEPVVIARRRSDQDLLMQCFAFSDRTFVATHHNHHNHHQRHPSVDIDHTTSFFESTRFTSSTESRLAGLCSASRPAAADDRGIGEKNAVQPEGTSIGRLPVQAMPIGGTSGERYHPPELQYELTSPFRRPVQSLHSGGSPSAPVVASFRRTVYPWMTVVGMHRSQILSQCIALLLLKQEQRRFNGSRFSNSIAMVLQRSFFRRKQFFP